jgi:hypothetical protein
MQQKTDQTRPQRDPEKCKPGSRKADAVLQNLDSDQNFKFI